MSVINKMLRDLDQRRPGLTLSGPVHGQSAVAGAVALAGLPATGRSALVPRPLVWGGGLFLAAAAMGGLWHTQTSQRNSSSAPVVAITATTFASAPAMAAPEVALPSPSPSPVAAASAVPAFSSRELSMKPGELASPVAEKPKAVSQKKGAEESPAPQLAKAAPAVAALSKPVANTQLLNTDFALSNNSTKAVLAAPQVAPGRSSSETLALASSMWHAGSRMAAMNVLRQTLSQVEASSAIAVPVTAQSDLARLASELARMELAEGQVSQALALLTRLEPQLSQIAEVWAMRGNAAQRLGQHVQAVKSYQRALVLKPGEPRWMQGQAVSLAALGQISEAAELAEITRAMGALRPEVANYLRQLGVTVRTD